MLKFVPCRLVIMLVATLALPALAGADIVVVASKNAAADSLDKKTVKKLWLGKTRKIPGMGKVTILDQADGSDIKAQFYKKTTNKTASQVKAYWAKIIFTGKAFPPKSVSSDNQALEQVRASDSTIAYIDSSSVDDSVKILFTIK